MKNIVILISGRGSNMEAVVRAAQAEQWPARIVAVISNKADAGGLQFAQAHGIPTAVVANKDFATRAEFDAALQQVIDGYAPDLVVLAGFMRILTAPFVEHYAGRMLNIHPSLLPEFPGLATHRNALEAGVAEHGATVHFRHGRTRPRPDGRAGARAGAAGRHRSEPGRARAGAGTPAVPARDPPVHRRQAQHRAGRCAHRRHHQSLTKEFHEIATSDTRQY